MRDYNARFFLVSTTIQHIIVLLFLPLLRLLFFVLTRTKYSLNQFLSFHEFTIVCALVEISILVFYFMIESCSCFGISTAQFSKLRYMTSCYSCIDLNDGIFIGWTVCTRFKISVTYKYTDVVLLCRCSIDIYTDCDRYHFTTCICLYLAFIHETHIYISFVNCFKRLNLKLEHKHRCVCVCVYSTCFK